MPESSTSNSAPSSAAGAAPTGTGSAGSASDAGASDSARAGQLERGRLSAMRQRDEAAAAEKTPRTRFAGAGLGAMAMAAARGAEPEPPTKPEGQEPGGLKRGTNEAATAGERGLRPGKHSTTEEAAAAEKKKKAEDERKKKKAELFKRQYVYPAYASVWTDYYFGTFIGLNVYWFLCLTTPKLPFKMASWEKLYMVFVDCVAPAILFCILIIMLIISCISNPIMCAGIIGLGAIIGLGS